jgi:hypothetical protein
LTKLMRHGKMTGCLQNGHTIRMVYTGGWRGRDEWRHAAHSVYGTAVRST